VTEEPTGLHAEAQRIRHLLGGGLVPVAYPYCDTCKGEVSSFVLHTDQEGLARPGPADFELRPCGHRSTYTSPPGYELHGRAVRDR
jgi:hypothetical protein